MIISADLYSKIIRIMPIPCVDLIVQDNQKKILLIKRGNEPAKGEWWFPGGRVYFGETRLEASKRKLNEECGLQAISIEEIGTYDVILTLSSGGLQSHGITTLYRTLVQCTEQAIALDEQSIMASWRNVEEWQCESLPPFVMKGLSNV